MKHFSNNLYGTGKLDKVIRQLIKNSGSKRFEHNIYLSYSGGYLVTFKLITNSETPLTTTTLLALLTTTYASKRITISGKLIISNAAYSAIYLAPTTTKATMYGLKMDSTDTSTTAAGYQINASQTIFDYVVAL